MKIERMSKEDFVKNLNIIKKDIDFYEELYTLCRKNDRDDDINILPNSISVAINCLEKAIGDKYEYVSWWCWEKNWGKEGKDFCVYDEYGEIIPTETPEDIYNIITDNIENDEKGD